MRRFINGAMNNVKIKTKLFTLYLSITIITLFIIGAYLAPKISNFVIENAIKETMDYNNTIKDRVKQVLELAVSISDVTFYEEKLHEVVTDEYNNALDVYKAYDDYQMLDKYTMFSDEIKSIRLFVDNPTILTNSTIIKVSDNIKESSWYNQAITDKGLITWYYKLDEITGIYSLSLVREIRTETNGHIGVLVIGIDENCFQNIINTQFYKASILLDGIVIYSDALELGSKVNLEEDTEEASLYRDFNNKYREGNKYKILDTFKIKKSSNNTFKILGEVSLDVITREPMWIIRKTIVITLVIILISLIIVIYFLESFYERINMLKREMHKVVEGNFNIQKKIEGHDEISEIYDDIYIMMESINNLIDDVYKKEIQQEQLIAKQREIEFKMLSSQINPHFLYNTLETIRMRAFSSGDRELATIVKKLGKLMRRNLEVSNEEISLEAEVNFIEDYLDIQGLRFGGRIKYEINVLVDAKKYKVIPLLLQPIVENAIIYGLESRIDSGKLNIKVYEEARFLIVEIMDNGCGIDDEQLEIINSSLFSKANNTKGNSSKGKSIGITNVNERIKIFFGEQYGLRIYSELNVGTKVFVILPAIKEGVEHANSINCR